MPIVQVERGFVVPAIAEKYPSVLTARYSASRSLRVDTQGKTLALALLQMALEQPENHQEMTRKQ